MQAPVKLGNLVTWHSTPSKRAENGGKGCCNTGALGWKTICALGGIGCNVNHEAVRLREELDRLRRETGTYPGQELLA